MKELDQQYEGGTAPCLPPTSSFRSNERDTHRADKGPEDNTRPSGRRRTNHSVSYNVSLQKAKEPNRFKIIYVEQYSPSQACITIKTSDGKFYSINFDKSTTCSCPFSDIQTHIRQGKVSCKHRLFVLMAIGFSEEDEMLLQYSYTALEIRNIISKVCNWQRNINDQPNNPLQSSSQGKTCRDLKVSTACVTEHKMYEFTFLQGLISKCYGCEKNFTATDKQKPNDIVIRHLELRPSYSREKNEWFIRNDGKISNAYYHANIQCVKKFTQVSVQVQLLFQ
jgi:hypothetical protein